MTSAPERQSRPTPRKSRGIEAAPHTTWTVRPGDHLWGIAADTLRDRLGRTPADAEIAPYWRRLIAANRSRLVDQDNPDLIFPGQVFTLPE